MQVMNEWTEVGVEQGKQVSSYKGKQELVLRQLQCKVGTLTPALAQTVKLLDLDALAALGQALPGLNSPADLTKWLTVGLVA
jgi:hypothetical protein